MVMDTNSPPILGGTHNPSIMDIWVSPRILNKIANMESILAILQNPVMSIPLEELGLKPETVATLKNGTSLKFGAHLLTVSDWRGTTTDAQEDIQSVLSQHNVNMGALSQLVADCGDRLEEFYLIRRWVNLDTQEQFQSQLAESVSHAQKCLQTLKAERQQEIDALHVVTIELPDTLRLLNDSPTIIDTAEAILRAEFSKAVQTISQGNVERDVAEMKNPTSAPATTVQLTWFDRLIDRMVTYLASEPETTPEPEVVEPAPSHDVPTFTLQFGVSAKLDVQSTVCIEDVETRKKLLMPIFAQVADDLSGTVLTTLISERLDPNPSEEPAELVALDWIQTQTPYVR